MGRSHQPVSPGAAWTTVAVQALVTVVLASGLLPSGLADIGFLGVGLATCLVGFFGIVRNRPAKSWPWWLAVGSAATFLAADVARHATHAIGDLGPGRPLLPDVLAYGAFGLLGAALLGMRHDHRADIDALLDSLIVGMASLALIWRFVVQPAIGLWSAPMHVRLVLAGYLPASVVVVVLAAQLFFARDWAWRTDQVGLLGAVVLLCVGDGLSEMVDGHVGSVGSYWILGVYSGAYLCATLALLHPSLGEPSVPAVLGKAKARVVRLGTVVVGFATPAVLAAFPRPTHSHGTLAVIVLSLAALVVARVVRLFRAQESLIERATTDPLTHLANRAAFEEMLPALLLAARLAEKSLAVAYVDLDNFKEVNDVFGHAAGDEVLRRYATRLEAGTRRADMVARMGGDEFVAVFYAPEGADAMAATAERLRSSLARPIEVTSGAVSVTASIGVAYFDPGGLPERAADLLGCADSLLYASKNSGRDRVTTVTGASATSGPVEGH